MNKPDEIRKLFNDKLKVEISIIEALPSGSIANIKLINENNETLAEAKDVINNISVLSNLVKFIINKHFGREKTPLEERKKQIAQRREQKKAEKEAIKNRTQGFDFSPRSLKGPGGTKIPMVPKS